MVKSSNQQPMPHLNADFMVALKKKSQLNIFADSKHTMLTEKMETFLYSGIFEHLHVPGRHYQNARYLYGLTCLMFDTSTWL